MSIKRATFSGHSFAELGGQATNRRHSINVSVRHIPGGDRSYIDISGRPLPTLTIPMFFDSNAEFSAFEVLVGSQGTLSVQSGTFTALLTSATPGTLLPDGGQYASAEFVML